MWGQAALELDTSRAFNGRWMKEEDSKVKRDTLKCVGMAGRCVGMFKAFKGALWVYERNVMGKLEHSSDVGWK